MVKKKPHLTHFRLVITEGPVEQKRPATQKATYLGTAYSQNKVKPWGKKRRIWLMVPAFFFLTILSRS